MSKLKLETLDELNEWAEDKEKELQMLRSAVKASWKEDSPRQMEEEDYANFGALMKAVAARNTDKVVELGGSPGSVDVDTKATLGTALTDDAVTGSYLVPEQFLANILRIADEESELKSKIRTVKMTTRKANYPKKLTGVSFSRVTSDAADLTESGPTFTEVEMEAESWALFISCTEAFLEDSLPHVGRYFSEIIGEAYLTTFEANFLNHAANPTGILQNTSAEIVTMGAGYTGFADIGGDDLFDVVAELTTRAKRRNAHWFMHPTILDLVARIKNANGDYIFARPTDAAPRTLLGYPIILSDQMPDTGDSAESTAMLAFGNPQEFLYGNRIGLEIRFYPNTVHAVSNTETFFRARFRASWDVAHDDSFVVLKTAGE